MATSDTSSRPHCGNSAFCHKQYAAYLHIAALVRLLQYTEANKPNYGAMSDEELESAIWELGGPLPGEED